MHEDNCFITLTYNDQHLPPDGTLDHRVFQKFMKRLRKKYPHKIRYYMCGEYGENFGRPHYHACLFNHDFKDKTPWSERDGVILYRSKELEKLWSDENGEPMGFATVGGVTFQSAAYVARYIMKKISGDLADDHYQKIDAVTGEITKCVPEYTNMSLKPGIGACWLDQYQADVYPHDFVVINGKKVRPPRAYDRTWELLYPEEMALIKARRRRLAGEHSSNNSDSRLRVREKVQEAKVKQLKRTLS